MLRELIELNKKKFRTYDNLAKRLGVYPSYISEWKSGVRTPTTTQIMQMADFVGYNPLQVLCIVMEDLDEEHKELWNKWRPYGDSNPGYRRERASIFFIKLIVNICKFIPKKVNILKPHVNFQVLNERNAG